MNKTNRTTTFVGKLCSLLLMLLLTTPVLANGAGNSDTVVSGIVTENKTGEPLIGVTVSVVRDGRVESGVITDIDGHFTMPTPTGDYEIHISYIGYQTVVLKSGRDKMQNVHIRMQEESNALSDVVVTGFFNKNKKSFTGAVTSMSGLELKQVSGVNIVTAIAALTPGMSMVQNSSQGSNPNHVPELILRGTTSFNNEGQSVNQPTIILDGTEITMQDLYDLDINEVENNRTERCIGYCIVWFEGCKRCHCHHAQAFG
ncbi:MAG: carboxypeptidase-like regulatory domain-containing protein [Bacteroidaceae bacterium]|nr:carboxypeptidase-like regulatory domain-containing protein [Bacteroidaceae bacterium]